MFRKLLKQARPSAPNEVLDELVEIFDEIDEKQLAGGTYNLAQILADTGLAASKGEARRLIEQGGVKVNGEKATAANADIVIDTDGVLFQVGKRKFLKVKSL